MSTKKETCPHCGASMMANRYTMNLTLVRCLAKVVSHGGGKVSEMQLTKSEYANISKLKYWGFLYKTEDGEWYPTVEALNFLRGWAPAPKDIFYFRNKLVRSEGSVYVHEVFRTEESKQKYREYMEPIFNNQKTINQTLFKGVL